MTADRRRPPGFSTADIRALRLLGIVCGVILAGFGFISRGDARVLLLAIALQAVMGGSAMGSIWLLRRFRARQPPPPAT